MHCHGCPFLQRVHCVIGVDKGVVITSRLNFWLRLCPLKTSETARTPPARIGTLHGLLLCWGKGRRWLMLLRLLVLV